MLNRITAAKPKPSMASISEIVSVPACACCRRTAVAGILVSVTFNPIKIAAITIAKRKKCKNPLTLSLLPVDGECPTSGVSKADFLEEVIARLWLAS
jgi:hypothetical protein